MRRPDYERDGVRLWCADSLDLLREIPDGSICALVTDPPYSSGGAFRSDRMRGSDVKYSNDARFPEFGGDNRDQRAFAYWCALWLSEAHRCGESGALSMLFTDWRQLPSTTDALQSGGWVWHGIVPWVKTNARSFSGRFTAQCEYVVWGSKGALPNPLDGGTSYPGFYTCASPQDREHAAQKPEMVMRALLGPTRQGGVVLDPFMGSGTTGVAAVREGRQFWGIERERHYFDIAARRIDSELSQGRLFPAEAVAS